MDVLLRFKGASRANKVQADSHPISSRKWKRLKDILFIFQERRRRKKTERADCIVKNEIWRDLAHDPFVDDVKVVLLNNQKGLVLLL